MRFVPVLIVAVILTSPLSAETGTPPERYATTTVFGSDACPTPKGDEIVVCGRLPESDRYRIPKALRKKKRVDSGVGASWASRVRTLEEAQRFTRPGSCTAIGSFGQSGCTEAMLRQWFEDRQRAQAEKGAY
jgi:hypothetical protein